MSIVIFTCIGFKWHFPHIIELGEGIEVRLKLLSGYGNYLFC